MYKTIVLITTILFATIANANERPPVVAHEVRAGIEGEAIASTSIGEKGRVGIYQLEEVVRDKGEVQTMDDFAKVLGERLMNFTEQTNYEACAVICQTDGQWGARIVTVHAHAFCPIVYEESVACPADMKATDADIHSHITVSSYRPNAIDRLALRREYKRGQSAYTTPSQLSPTDIEQSKNGYMVHTRGLLHHTGSERSVRRIE